MRSSRTTVATLMATSGSLSAVTEGDVAAITGAAIQASTASM
jgi:hypothetical protein